MKITIEIQCDNEAFTDAIGTEAGRILRRLAHDLEEGRVDVETKLRDVNGNTVGFARMEE